MKAPADSPAGCAAWEGGVARSVAAAVGCTPLVELDAPRLGVALAPGAPAAAPFLSPRARAARETEPSL